MWGLARIRQYATFGYGANLFFASWRINGIKSNQVAASYQKSAVTVIDIIIYSV